MNVYSNSFFAMNTRLNYVLPYVDKQLGDNLNFIIKNLVNSWEKILSRFQNNAELKIINDSAFFKSVVVSGKLSEIIKICDKYVIKTNGLFDPAYSGQTNDYVINNKTNNSNSLRNTFCSWKDVEWNSEKQTIKFKNKFISLDFGSIGKGIALKEVVNVLKSKSIKSAFISFGESSIAGIGNHPSGNEWPISLNSINKEDYFRYMLKNDYISISGLHSTKEGSKPHIYHPLKRKLVNSNHRVMVKSHCPIEAEVLSTSLYLADPDEIDLLKGRFKHSEWIIDL